MTGDAKAIGEKPGLSRFLLGTCTDGVLTAIGDTPGLSRFLLEMDGVFSNTAGFIGDISGLTSGLAKCSSLIGEQSSSTKLPSCGLNNPDDRTLAVIDK